MMTFYTQFIGASWSAENFGSRPITSPIFKISNRSRHDLNSGFRSNGQKKATRAQILRSSFLRRNCRFIDSGSVSGTQIRNSFELLASRQIALLLPPRLASEKSIPENSRAGLRSVPFLFHSVREPREIAC